MVATVAAWWFGRPLPEIERTRRHFVELRRQVAAAERAKTTRSSDRARVLRLRAQARAVPDAQKAPLEAEAAALETTLAWGDAGVVRTAVRSGPLVPVLRSERVDGFPDPNPERGGACLGCHVSVASSGYEQYPAPFRTHPAFANYVGAASPHPPSRVACTACHLGNDHATTFAEAGHARAADDRREPPQTSRTWVSSSVDGAMLPRARTEAGCVACHLGERYQPGASALNDAVLTLERGGCYACHRVPGLEQAPRRGPDLRRIDEKLTREWVTLWLADPRAIKPSTWMPAFWPGRMVLNTPQRATIDAIVAYLFSSSGARGTPVASAGRATGGDVAHGKTIVESVGCLGCHVVGATPRDEASLRRTFGQPLQALAGKTTRSWLVNWVREPARYSPHTRMPNLRLSDSDAADVASYLGSIGEAPDLAAAGTPSEDDEAYRAVLDTYKRSASAADMALSGMPLRIAAGRAAIDALGCFNCHEIRGFDTRTTTVPIRPRQDWDEAAILTLFPDSTARSTAAMSGAVVGGPATDRVSDGTSATPVASPAASVPGLAIHPGPGFRFGPNEVQRLALALTAVAGRPRDAHALTTPWHLSKVSGRALVQDRNCVGCHPIEGTGGDMVRLVAEPTLGPPLLTPEGSRVQPAWLRGFLRQPSTIRPWLSLRMPTFGLADDELERVGEYFRSIAPENPKPTPLPDGVSAAEGRELFELLKCQQCHVLGSIPKDQPTSNLAPDLRMAHERLQPDWILAWLRNPGAILPGTRMPTFWPDYPKSYYAPLDKDGAKQVRAIRDHVLALR